jgi:hypothetical protein
VGGPFRVGAARVSCRWLEVRVGRVNRENGAIGVYWCQLVFVWGFRIGSDWCFSEVFPFVSDAAKMHYSSREPTGNISTASHKRPAEAGGYRSTDWEPALGVRC